MSERDMTTGLAVPSRLGRAAAIWNTFAADHERHGIWSGGHWVSVDAPPTGEEVLAALTGAGPAISSLFLGPDSYTSVGGLDVDHDDGWTSVEMIAAELLKANVTTYVEHSRRGGHVRVVSAQPMPALLMRRAFMAAIQHAGLDPTDPTLEIRSSKDRKTSPFAGGMLRLPWCRHPVTGERFPLLDAGTLELVRLPELVRSDRMALTDLAERCRAQELVASMPTPGELMRRIELPAIEAGQKARP